MSGLANEEIEGRLNALREALAFLIAHVVRAETLAGDDAGTLLDAFDAHLQFQDNQEDPGAVPSGPAFAIEGAMMREFSLLLKNARARLAELADQEVPPSGG